MAKFYLLQQREGQKPHVHIYQKALAARPDMKLIDAKEAARYLKMAEDGTLKPLPGADEFGQLTNPNDRVPKAGQIEEVNAFEQDTSILNEQGAVIMDEELTDEDLLIQDMDEEEREAYFANKDANRKFEDGKVVGEEESDEEDADLDPMQLVDFVNSLNLKNQLELFALSNFQVTIERGTVKEMQAKCIELIEQRYQIDASNESSS